MSSSLDQLEAHLTETVGAVLPEGWKLVPAEQGSGKRTGTIVFYEFGDLLNEYGGKPFPPSILGVEVTLTLQVPGSDVLKGSRAVMSAALDFVPILDSLPDIYWGPRAPKEVLDTGETVRRFTCTFLSNTNSGE